MASRQLREALIGRTHWNTRQLSSRVQHLRAQTPMTTGMAQAVLAHRNGVHIAKYLHEDEVHRVRDILAKLAVMSAGNGNGVKAGTRSKSATKKQVSERTIVFPSKFRLRDPFLPDAKVREAQEMAAVYPILYVLENSMREVVQRVMRAKHGADWWNSALTSGLMKELKERSDSRRKKEELTSWHQRRGAHPIDYIDLRELGAIIFAKQDDFFPEVLGNNRQWLEQFMREVEPSRNVLCHMNPLSELNARDLEVKAERWRQMLEERRDKIPPVR